MRDGSCHRHGATVRAAPAHVGNYRKRLRWCPDRPGEDVGCDKSTARVVQFYAAHLALGLKCVDDGTIRRHFCWQAIRTNAPTDAAGASHRLRRAANENRTVSTERV